MFQLHNHHAFSYIYLGIILAIALGWLGHGLYLELTPDSEPNVLIPGQGRILRGMNSLLTFSSAEVLSSQDHVSEEQIKVYDNKVVLYLDEPVWSSFTDTNSMDPLLDVGANGIEIQPKSPDDIYLGDVISYKRGERVIIHRVVGSGMDSEGVYYIVKGDNNSMEDAVKVRFSDVLGILIAVVY